MCGVVLHAEMIQSNAVCAKPGFIGRAHHSTRRTFRSGLNLETSSSASRAFVYEMELSIHSDASNGMYFTLFTFRLNLYLLLNFIICYKSLCL